MRHVDRMIADRRHGLTCGGIEDRPDHKSPFDEPNVGVGRCHAGFRGNRLHGQGHAIVRLSPDVVVILGHQQPIAAVAVRPSLKVARVGQSPER